MRNAVEHEQRLLSVATAATTLSISLRAAWDLISRGALPVVRVGPRTVRVDRRDLDRFIDERRERRGGAQ